ncbi:MAG: SMP-30/gluconolactonase/LRE family protein [Alphaproteobacteria bacterium]|nr:SMP-30/gluconolactonase/LRE family protein [Alphaproteobacteria bacterium]MCB9699319.1 SMP-30/gluconolactonase/LRE family protein [Alphaproteobacteria bacterium]
MNRLLRAGVFVGAIAVACGSWLLTWPVPIEPEAWDPPSDPGPAAERTLPAITLSTLAGDGPEDVEIDAQGRVYGGTQDGTIWRWSSPDAAPEAWVDTKGRPLGLTWGADGELLVCDAFRGLLSVSPEGRVKALTTTCGDRKLVFTDDLEVDASGRVWFTDATQRFDQHAWRLDILENVPSGRLCVYEPDHPGAAKEVLDGLAFANGVAVDPEGRFVLIAETARYRIRRYWTSGPKVGENDVLIDGLPGFPDGISHGADGLFWIAIASPRNPLLDRMAGSPFLREVVARLPAWMGPRPERYTRVLGIDADGRIVHDLVDPDGTEFTTVTSVEQRGDRLLLGSLVEHRWASIPAP